MSTPLSSALLKAQAFKLGFSAVGVCAAHATPLAAQRLQAFLAQGRHGDMIWMETRAQERGAPKALWPAVESVIMLGLSYAPADDPLRNLANPEIGTISVYAQGLDYHDVVKKKLKALAGWLVAHAGGGVKVFVDTAPVMEKPLAQAAGLGWQGKHTNLVSRAHGSWLFLGALYTTLAFATDGTHQDRCGRCTACQDICPTQAFPAPYQLDARRCLAYLTIEHKGPMPLEFRAAMGNRIYGCDDCLAVCPWNKFAQTSQASAFHARTELQAPELAVLAKLDDAGFRALFAKSPIKRIGRNRFVRNVAYAMGNSKRAAYQPILHELSQDPDDVVCEAAQWALDRLASAALNHAE
jgi:epoxyqueuosine reductase